MQKILTHINKLTINRFTGVPIFLFVMYCLFFCSVCVGGVFQQFFDVTSNILFIDLPTWLLVKIAAPNWIQCIITQGVGRGINVTITFIPVLTGMFFFLAILENSGYITHAAFVMNNFMCYLGLPGKSFIPMLIGFGCNVSAVLGSKILHKRQDRILTIMMIPFISCGSKLAVYAIFVATFFPQAGQNIVFLLYLTGILVAIFTGFIFSHSDKKNKNCILTQELPTLRIPKLSVVCVSTMQHLKDFLFKVGSIIIPFCIIIGMLGNIKINTQETILELMGKKITPIFEPMGIQRDNWPAVVGLVSGVISKEVIIGTLTSLYEQEIITIQSKNNILTNVDVSGDAVIIPKILTSFQTACMSIPKNLVALKSSFLYPFMTDTTNKNIDGKVLGTLCLKFNNAIAAFSYLLFILLYCPCISVLAMITKELGIKWAGFVVAWTTGLAYIIAVAFYQTFAQSNVFANIVCGISSVFVFLGFTYLVKIFVYKKQVFHQTRLIPSKVV